jgi:glycosyltransferase involved in cell wall biosynthesis
MRILFPDISNPASGRGYFLNTLAKELPNHGVEVVFGDADHDVSLHPVRLWKKTRKPRILRIDGVYHDTGKDWKAKNIGIKDSVSKADGVIYQSNFSLTMAKAYLDLPEEKSTTIFNGAKVEDKKYDYIFSCKNIFLAVSKWRPHKRLTDTIESFLLAGIDDSQLIVIGDTRNSSCDVFKYSDNKKIVFAGPILDRDILMQYYHHAIASIHLCWFDSCPNSVVEAICRKCPVITNNVGGTHELVGPSGGVICIIDKPYDLFPVDLYHPPRIDRNIVANAIVAVSKKRPKITAVHVDIKNIALQYKKYFERFV